MNCRTLGDAAKEGCGRDHELNDQISKLSNCHARARARHETSPRSVWTKLSLSCMRIACLLIP